MSQIVDATGALRLSRRYGLVRNFDHSGEPACGTPCFDTSIDLTLASFNGGGTCSPLTYALAACSPDSVTLRNISFTNIDGTYSLSHVANDASTCVCYYAGGGVLSTPGYAQCEYAWNYAPTIWLTGYWQTFSIALSIMGSSVIACSLQLTPASGTLPNACGTIFLAIRGTYTTAADPLDTTNAFDACDNTHGDAFRQLSSGGTYYAHRNIP